MGFGYDDEKAIFQHMDPNKRFEIYRCIPSLRGAERATPLRIDNLEFKSTGTQPIIVNDTKYVIGVFEVDESGNRVFDIPMNEEYGSFSQLDVDEFGFRKWCAGLDTKTDGDVFMSDRIETDPTYDTIGFYESEINEEMAYMGKDLRGREAQQTSKLINDRKRKMQAQINKRDGIRPQFEIQLKVISKNGEETYLERVKYTKKRFEAVKSLMESFFGGRRHPIQIKTWEVHASVPLRLPIEMKFKVQRLQFHGDFERGFGPLSSVIDESSFPLGKLVLHDAWEQNLQQQVVKEARELIYCDSHEPEMDALMRLPNKKVVVLHQQFVWSSQDFIRLIRHWLEVGREIGTSFSAATRGRVFELIMMTVGRQVEGAQEKDGLVIIPMNAFSQLEMGVEPLGDIADGRIDHRDRNQLTIKVAPLGTVN